MARHFARTGQPSKDRDWGNDVLAELFPAANPIWLDANVAANVATDTTNAWAMVIGKVGMVDALGGVVEADTFLSLRKRGSPSAQYWEKYDGEHAILEQFTTEELDIFLAVQVRSSTHIVWMLQGPAPGQAEISELQTEVWQQSAGYIVQREAVMAGGVAQAPVQWNSVEMARPDLSRSDITGWPRELWDDGRERQHNNQCLKHAVNNLFEMELLTVEYMNWLSVRQSPPGNVDRDWSGKLFGVLFAWEAVKIYQPASDLTLNMLNRVEYPAHRWYEYVTRHGQRDSRMDPYGFILQDHRGEGHFYAIRSVDPAPATPGGGATHWEILNSIGSVKPAPMDNEQLDAYLCDLMATRDYNTYSLPRKHRLSVEQLRAQPLDIITISEAQVERARGEATEDEASEATEEEEAAAIPASTPVNDGPFVVAPRDAIDRQYFLAQFPLIASAWSTGDFIQSLG